MTLEDLEQKMEELQERARRDRDAGVGVFAHPLPGESYKPPPMDPKYRDRWHDAD